MFKQTDMVEGGVNSVNSSKDLRLSAFTVGHSEVSSQKRWSLSSRTL